MVKLLHCKVEDVMLNQVKETSEDNQHPGDDVIRFGAKHKVRH